MVLGNKIIFAGVLISLARASLYMQMAALAKMVDEKLPKPICIKKYDNEAEIVPPKTVYISFCFDTLSRTEKPKVPIMQVNISSKVITSENY